MGDTALANAVGLVNTTGLAGVAIGLMTAEAKIGALPDSLPGGLGMPTHVDAAAAAGGDGSAARPFRTLDAAVTKINLDGATLAALAGTPAELAAAMQPARVYLAAGTYTQSKPFTAPAIVIPAPGAVIASLAWAPPAHASASTAVPFTGGVIVEDLNGGDPAVVGDLAFVTVAPTAGSWAHSLIVAGPVAGTATAPDAFETATITTSGPQAVTVVVDKAATTDVTMAAGNLVATQSTITGTVTIAAGATVLNETSVSGLITTAGISPGVVANDSSLGGGVTGDVNAFDCIIVGPITGDSELHNCDVRGVTAITGDVTFIDSSTWAQLVAVGVTPVGTVSLFGTLGSSVVAGVSPQVIPFGVTFPFGPLGVTVTPQAAAIDATTFCGITAVSPTGVTVAFGGVGAAAPTVLHWVATLG